jgi:hypothetical protein
MKIKNNLDGMTERYDGITGLRAGLESPMQIMTKVADAITESVALAGAAGVNGGLLYSTLMLHGCTLQQFNTIMSVLCEYGKLRKDGDLYFAVAVRS